MTPNRVVAMLTPLLFAPAAGAAAAWLAKHFPGAQVKQDDLQEIFIAGAIIALGPAVQWLHGWQKYEARQADADLSVQLAELQAAQAQARAQQPLAAGDFQLDDEFEPLAPARNGVLASGVD